MEGPGYLSYSRVGDLCISIDSALISNGAKSIDITIGAIDSPSSLRLSGWLREEGCYISRFRPYRTATELVFSEELKKLLRILGLYYGEPTRRESTRLVYEISFRVPIRGEIIINPEVTIVKELLKIEIDPECVLPPRNFL